MKKTIKTITILMIFIIFIENSIVLANVVNIGEIKYIERGEQGFYSIQYWNEKNQKWYYIIYSRTYYTDNDGQKRIAYCINPDRIGIGWVKDEYEGYDASIQEKLSNEKLWRVYKNGYPYATPDELGVETEDDAYLATKQAAYCILRNQTAEEVYDYYRPGNTSINGESIEDIDRRGQKVINAIYKLVNIGNNGTDKISNIKITRLGDFKRQGNYSNYNEQEYLIENNNEDITVTLTNIKNAPQGTYITDLEGNRRTVFKGGEKFKVIIPRWNIKEDYNITIEYSSTFKNYPIYYAKSLVEGTQDYLLSAEKYEDDNGEIDCFLNSKRSKFEINKKDADTKEPIENIKFNIKYENGENIGDFTTDENGKICIEGLRPGKIQITEIDSGEVYIHSDSSIVHTIEYDSNYEITIYNKSRKGDLELLKVDKDNNEKVLPNVEFELVDNKDKVIAKERTNEEGKIVFNNIKIGNYILRETETLEGYKLIPDQSVEIKENETINIKIENEKKKGRIKIIKVDKDNNNIKIQGAVFGIYNLEGELIERIETDKDGLAYSSEIPIGKYYIQEIESTKSYILNDEIYNIEIKEDETIDIKIENEKKKGKIKIIKISKEYNKLNEEPAGSPIENTKFQILSSEGEIIQTLSTDENGIAISEDIVPGKYFIKEIEAGKWYVINNNIYEIEVNENNEIVEITIENDPADPEVIIDKDGPEKISKGKEIKYNFKIENIGNTDIDNLIWYEFLPYEKAAITKLSTGTFNQEINYNIYYKTNLEEKYVMIRENVNSKINNYIDFSEIKLKKDEVIVEVKIEFGDVKEKFKSIEEPYIYMKVKDDLENNEQIINETILDGYYDGYKITYEDVVNTVITSETIQEKRLPRTGF